MSRIRLKAVAALVTSAKPLTELPYVALENIASGQGRLASGADLLRVVDGSSGMATARPGDVLFGKLRPYLCKSLLVGQALHASTELVIMRPAPRLLPRWFSYLVASRPFVDWAVATSEGSKMPRTSWERLAEFRFVLPDAPVQSRVADFLDAETGRIDGLVSKKRRGVELLRERRGALVMEAAMGRRFGDGRRKCGLQWLPTLPQHWAEVRLSLVARIGSGHTPSRRHSEWWAECDIPWITTGDVSQMRSDRVEYVTETREMISQLGVANSAAEVHPAGTVVLSRTASAGFSAIMGVDMATSQDYVTWTCGPRLRPRFLLLALRAMRTDLLGRLAQGSTHKTIYMPDLMSLRIPLPPLRDQDSAVSETWARLRPVIDAEDLLERQINLLLERRQALITAAVTGQISVPT